MQTIIKKRFAKAVLGLVALMAVISGYLLYYPYALSNKVEELIRTGKDFSSIPFHIFFWTPAEHVHNSCRAYREYNHARLKNLPNYEAIVWWIK